MHHHPPATQDSSPAPLGRADARRLTDQIRDRLGRLYDLVAEAYEGRAHIALGYATWEEYTEAEFGMSRSHAYRLIEQARAVRELTEVSPTGDKIHIPERAAREIGRHLPVVKQQLADAFAQERAATGMIPSPHRIDETTAAVVGAVRGAIRAGALDDTAGGPGAGPRAPVPGPMTHSAARRAWRRALRCLAWSVAELG